MAIFSHLPLLFLLLSLPSLSNSSPFPPEPQPQPPTQQALLLSPILSSLGYTTLSSSLPSISSPVLATWQGPLTLFAPSDSSLQSCLQSNHPSSCTPLRLVRDHIVPGLFPLSSLLSLPFSSKLSTASQGRCLTLTSTSVLNSSVQNPKLFVNGVEITRPDIFNNGQFVIHGIQGFVAPLSPFSCLHHVSVPKPLPGVLAGTGSVVPLMLEDAISRLHKNGYGFLALAMRVKYQELAALTNMTVFALTDTAIFTGGHEYVTAVRFHVIPNHLLIHSEMLKLQTGTVLPTLEEGKHLVVTHGFGPTIGTVILGTGLFSINYVPVKDPDVVINSRIAVHGLVVPFPKLYLADAVASGLEMMKTTGTTSTAGTVGGASMAQDELMCRSGIGAGTVQCADVAMEGVNKGVAGPAPAPAEAAAAARVRFMGFGDEGL